MSPWFQAKLWFVRAGIDAHASGVAQLELPEAKKNQFGSANGVKVGVLAASAVTMCRVFISVLSASATMMLFSTALVYGFSQLSCAISRSSFRVTASVCPGLPVMYTVGASSEWTVKGVVSPNCVAIIRERFALISPTRSYEQGVVTPSQPAGVGVSPTKWSPSSTVKTNSVFDLLIPSAA